MKQTSKVTITINQRDSISLAFTVYFSADTMRETQKILSPRMNIPSELNAHFLVQKIAKDSLVISHIGSCAHFLFI
jgi:hypothetical protein